MSGVTHNTEAMITRIQNATKAMAPSSPQLKETLTRIGLYVTALAKVNARRHALIDTGRLINSIRYEFFKDGPTEGVQVGSFNVPYAAVHEFGYRGTQYISAHQRRNSTVSAHTREMRIRARPYIRPAVSTARTFILDTLRAAVSFAEGK